MYKNIVVTLDGSEQAEFALPHVEMVARGCEMPNIILVGVVEPSDSLPLDSAVSAGIVSQAPITRKFETERERIKDEMRKYLGTVAGRLNGEGLNTSIKLLIGPIAEMIIDYVNKNNIDLVIISTHGRTGISRSVFGSVADKVLHGVCAPVLMARVPGCGILYKE